VQEIGQELGRLSGESLSFLKASWQKTVAAASQQQQQLSERLRQQREQQQGAAGSPDAPAAVASSQSTPQLHAPAGYKTEWDEQQQQQHRSASEACIAGANSNSSRAAPAWLPASGGGSAAIAAGAASAGQNLLAGFQQGGRQLKALTSRLGSRLLQQQQQYNAVTDASLQDAAAGPGQGQAGSAWQQLQQQQPLGYTGEWQSMSAMFC
jgi:uncharacterized glyoxalase superfamily metalloenzyme YdcJ